MWLRMASDLKASDSGVGQLTYDFAMDPSIWYYICTFDFTEPHYRLWSRCCTASYLLRITSRDIKRSQKLTSLVALVSGNVNEERDAAALDVLLDVVRENGSQPELIGRIIKQFPAAQ